MFQQIILQARPTQRQQYFRSHDSWPLMARSLSHTPIMLTTRSRSRQWRTCAPGARDTGYCSPVGAVSMHASKTCIRRHVASKACQAGNIIWPMRSLVV
jgi:hypothetical protein